MPNRLAKESSPYLLQHANNPVDWYPWGEEALGRARTEDKPILLSIGYSACHWCHVMEHECFENEPIARLMNENFINIKVDREERPDLDHIYMEAVQAMTGGGGWPLTVFLTPDGKPFYGGTYFPPEDKQNHPGFPKVLKAVAETYHIRRSVVEQTICQITDRLSALTQFPVQVEGLTENTLKQAYSSLVLAFDLQQGGFGGAPKFPYPMTLEFLLRYYTRSREKVALEMVELTLKKIADGGIYDQIGGGFHRYATDKEWQYPHFEKMLYDNALVTRVYLHAFLVTGNRFYASIVEETLDYVLREMRSTGGGFYGTQDADSEGEEGKYYLWTLQEMEEVLGDQTAQRVENYLGVSAEGNFDGRNILHRTGHLEDPQILKEAKKVLLSAREKRIKPGRDEKILASWNGLMLTTLAEAAGVLQRPDYLSAAIAGGTFLLNSMMPGGKLRHTYKDGQARIEGFLEDYASVVEALLSLHLVTLEGKWLKTATGLTATMIGQFLDVDSGMLYDTAAGQKDLIARPRNDYDGALPAGTSAATSVLLKIAWLTGEKRYREIVERALSSEQENMAKTPLGTSHWLCALDFYLSAPKEIVIVGARENALTQEFLRTINTRWRPNQVVAAFDSNDPDSAKELPVFEDRQMVNGKPTVFICQNNVCQSPITEAKELENRL